MAQSRPSITSIAPEPHGAQPAPAWARAPLVGLSDVIAFAESLLRRDEADVLFLIGNVALVALDLVDWPVAALALAVHAMARTRVKALETVAEVCEEVG